MNKNLPLVVIVGATGVGKTEVSIQLAQDIGGEIICADSRTFYKGMDIGTAKPTLEEREKVPHHMVDILTPAEEWSLAEFQNHAMRLIPEIHKRGGIPFLVGGSGQYIQAVVYGWKPPAIPPNARLREILERLAVSHGREFLHKAVRVLDPQAADLIDERNVRRSIRALEVILLSGRKFSEQRIKQRIGIFKTLLVGLTRPRQVLYERIDQRVEAMFSSGILEETLALLKQGYQAELPAMSAIGYGECVAVIKGEITIDQAKAEIKRKTRVFVRRQANWFKATDPEIQWFDLTREPVTAILNYLTSELNF